MNEASKNKKKVLVTSFTKEDVIDLLPIIREFEKNGSTVTVLGVDFNSWIELRKRNIQYKTPAVYFDKKKCSKIDSEAVRLARCWYKPIEDKITYHGICLGEMAEYNFVFLFIDALRSIEIATSLIDIEKPDEIWLPKNIPVCNPNAVRYESLPRAINAVAKSKGIRVSYNNSNSLFRTNKNSEESLIRNIASNALNGIKRICLKMKSPANRNQIVFIDVPTGILFSIKSELEKKPTKYYC